MLHIEFMFFYGLHSFISIPLLGLLTLFRVENKELILILFLAHANCTLFCALSAQRGSSQQCKKTFFLCLMTVFLGVVK